MLWISFVKRSLFCTRTRTHAYGGDGDGDEEEGRGAWSEGGGVRGGWKGLEEKGHGRAATSLQARKGIGRSHHTGVAPVVMPGLSDRTAPRPKHRHALIGLLGR